MKFKFGDKVHINLEFYRGEIGKVIQYNDDSIATQFLVEIVPNFQTWFSENILTLAEDEK